VSVAAPPRSRARRRPPPRRRAPSRPYRAPDPSRRIRLLLFCCGLLLLAVAARAVYLQVIDHSHYTALASAEHRSTVVLHASRGDIVDRTGQEMAVSDQATTIGAYVPLANPAGTAKAIAAALGLDPESVYAKLANPDVKGHIDVVRQADPVAAKRLEAQKLPGLTFLPEERRVYPAGTGTAIVGTTDIDGNGLAGLEKSYDAQLRGRDGHEAFVQSGGLDQLTLSPIQLDAPRNGARLELSLDLEIQDAAERLAQKALQQTGAQTVTILQIDPRTGGVLSMASAPGPLETPYGDATAEQVKLTAIADQYEPGSTFKPVTVAAGLDRKVISPRSTFVVPGCMNLYDRRICDAEPHGVVTMSVADILRHSSNVGTVQIAYQKLSGKGEAAHGQYFAPYINRFGFARRTGIDLPGELQGQVPPYSKWSGVTIGNIPFGQGIAATPIQLGAFYAMLADGGVWRQPHVVSRINDKPVDVATRRELPKRVTTQLTKMLEDVVLPGGTGERAAIPGYRVAGKTGTTQKVIGGTYSNDHYVAFFAGYAPSRDPRVMTLVIVDDPDGTQYHGGEAAAPVFAQATAKALQVLGVPPQKGI
jgi:cell division protein FtsI (penicillin-binding protein 3)/stage V sporulation protein D (sporulation-specific penicillin-binding protein)